MTRRVSGDIMAITVNIYYTGEGTNAVNFAEEMVSSGIVDDIRNEPGNLRYEYFFPMDDKHTVLLIDSWENQEAIDAHHDTADDKDRQRQPAANVLLHSRFLPHAFSVFRARRF